MTGYGNDECNSSLNLMASRLGVFHHKKSSENLQPHRTRPHRRGHDILDPAIDEMRDLDTRLFANGGGFQQERMIFDKRRSLDRALLYSYQATNIRKVGTDKKEHPVRALINPDKNKFDYDDKILSVNHEHHFKPGDVFEWLGTKTYWLVCLQDLTEVAYFRGEIRRCSYEIDWQDEDGLHSTFAAVRGPVETKINYIQKHQISVDTPNHTLHILMPRTKAALEYFRRYSKFYLKGTDEGSPEVCWRVEATDWISTPGILEITAMEYYANEYEDDIENGIAGGLIVKDTSPNTEEIEGTIIGETFIKPKMVYEFEYQGPQILLGAEWTVDKKYPVEIEQDPNDNYKVKIKWKSTYSGQFDIKFGEYVKTIVVESLF